MTKKRVQTTTETASEPPALWSELEWNGHPLWRCAFCNFDTFDKQGILQHWRNRHAPRISRKEMRDDISS